MAHIINDFRVNKGDINELNILIKNYINDTYSEYGYSYGIEKDLLINNKIINSIYINLFINNFTIFDKISRENNITNFQQFKIFIENNLNIFSPKSDYFKSFLRIVMITKRKSNIGEKLSIEKFNEVTKQLDFNIDIKEVDTNMDQEGIDAYFEYDNKIFTICINPFIEYKIENDEIIIKTNGEFIIETNYVILYHISNNKIFVILRNDFKNNGILVENNLIKTHINNIISK